MKLKTTALIAGALVLTVACGSDESGGADILPHISPVQLGDLWPLGENESDTGSIERTPYEWVLLLQSTGDSTLEIVEVCILGDSSNWTIEGPEPQSVRVGEQAGVRLTYNRQSPGRDVIAVAVKSNAEKLGTLIVPVCAAVVADGTDKNASVPVCEFPENQIPSADEICN